MLDTLDRPSSDLHCGLGPCKYCSCRRFKGSGSICEECEHRIDEHTTGYAPEREDPTTAFASFPAAFDKRR